MRSRSRLVGLVMGAVAAAAAVSPMYADTSTVGVDANLTVTISGLGSTAAGLLGTVLAILQGLLGGLPIGI